MPFFTEHTQFSADSRLPDYPRRGLWLFFTVDRLAGYTECGGAA